MGLFERCADEMIAVSKRRNVSLRASMDLLPPNMLTDTFKEYAHRPQWCSPNGYAVGDAKQQSGVGSLRRIMDVEAFLRDVAAYRDHKCPKEAA
jgi:hypothetical protein